MVIVSSAFISSRRERTRFSVLPASGCAFKAAAWVDVLRVGLDTLGKTDLDNTDGARDHSFPVSRTPNPTLTGYTTSCGVKGFNMPEFLTRTIHSLCRLPAAVRVPQGG